MTIFKIPHCKWSYLAANFAILSILSSTHATTAEEKIKHGDVNNGAELSALVGKQICVVGNFQSYKEGPVLCLNDKSNSTIVIKFDADVTRKIRIQISQAEMKKVAAEMNSFVRQYQNGHSYSVTGNLGYQPAIAGRPSRPGTFAQGESPYFFFPKESLKIVPYEKPSPIQLVR